MREKSRTIGIAAGNQENIYEIPFEEREVFERVWPVILTLKSKGAPITLYRVEPARDEQALWNNAKPCVRILAPSEGVAGGPGAKDINAAGDANIEDLVKKGKMLRAGPPWPKEILSPKGELPEYVQLEEVEGKPRWVPAKGLLGFSYRARVDIVVVLDGTVIDLNRVPLPPDTSIVDKRWPK